MSVHHRTGSRAGPSVQLPQLVAPAGYPGLLRPVEPDPHRWARVVIGVTLGLAIFLFASPAVAAGVTMAGWWMEGQPESFPTYAAATAAFERPVGMLAANLSIALVLIPISIVLVRVGHRGRLGRLVSVRGRVRWRWLAISLVIALPVYSALLLLSGDLPSPQPAALASIVAFLAVILFTSPLQAAAEEVFFRGYLTQAVGTLTAGPWPAILVSSLVFALLHGSQNLPLFVNRLAFGLLAGILAWATGGLEAPIAAHVVNNVLAYGAATLTGTVAELRAVSEVTWTIALVGVAGYAFYTAAAIGAARRRPDRTSTLAAEGGR